MKNRILAIILLIVYPVVFSMTLAAGDDTILSTMNSLVNIIDVPVEKTGVAQWYEGYQIKVIEKEKDNFAVSIGRFATEALTFELGVFESRTIKLEGKEIKVLMIKKFDKTSKSSSFTARFILNGLYETTAEPVGYDAADIFLLYTKNDYYCDQFDNSSPLCDQQLLDAVSTYADCLQVSEEPKLEKYPPNTDTSVFGALLGFSVSIGFSENGPKDGQSLKIGSVKGQKIYLQIKESVSDCKDSYQHILRALPIVLSK